MTLRPDYGEPKFLLFRRLGNVFAPLGKAS